MFEYSHSNGVDSTQIKEEANWMQKYWFIMKMSEKMKKNLLDAMHRWSISSAFHGFMQRNIQIFSEKRDLSGKEKKSMTDIFE